MTSNEQWNGKYGNNLHFLFPALTFLIHLITSLSPTNTCNTEQITEGLLTGTHACTLYNYICSEKKDPLYFFPIPVVLMFQCSRFLTEIFLYYALIKAFKWLISPILCDYPTLWNRKTNLWLNNAGVMPYLSNGKTFNFKQTYLTKCAKSPSIYSSYSKCPPAASMQACRRACHCL